jgi:hypothetical protein
MKDATTNEELGSMTLEAASVRWPSAALRWGGVPATVEEGETSIFFETPTPEALARPSATCVRTPGTRRRFAVRRAASLRHELSSVCRRSPA